MLSELAGVKFSVKFSTGDTPKIIHYYNYVPKIAPTSEF